MRSYPYLILIALWFVSLTASNAQQTILAQPGDQVNLQADEYRGSIQWEQSTDNTIWTPIDGGDINPFEWSISALPQYFRARIDEEGCDDAHYSEVISIISNDNVKYWSHVDTWGGSKPSSGEVVTIAAEDYIILDEEPPELGGLIINGTLEFDQKDLALSTSYIVVHGTLRIGYETAPHQHQALITLTDTNTENDIMEMGTRGIMVMSGNLELHGQSPEVIWTKLNASAAAGSTSIQLEKAVDWQAEDEIIISPTDYYEAGFGASVTQRVSLSQADGQTLILTEGLNSHRWGALQYPTPEGMSLSDINVVSPPVPDTENTTTPLVLDERAEVGNLTRNIVIQAPDDALWRDEGFGAHTMIMPGATAHVEGVEFKRVGQRGRLRRYGFHWHMLSYLGSATLADATGQYFRRNTINSSRNRGIVIHGTNGVLVQDNIVYDILGHGIFTEDAVERRNVIDGNLVLHIRNQNPEHALKLHETGELGASCFWISNPDNTIINNIAADSRTFGFWLAFPPTPWGDSRNVVAEDGIIMAPNRIRFGVFDNNTAHSNRNDGIHLDDVEVENDGTTSPLQYWSTSDGRGNNASETLQRFALSRYKTWKNMDNGAWDRAPYTDIYEVVSADNCGRFFAGSGANGVIERSLVVGTSLNHLMNETGRPPIADFQFHASASPAAFATYHSAFNMKDNIVVNFPVTDHDRQGVFASDDYYVRAVDKGQIRNPNNLMIQSHPGVKLKPAVDYFTFSSALWDPHGLWGPKGNYFVYDDDFLTYGKEITLIDLGTEIAGGVSVPGPFFGFHGFELKPSDAYYFDLMAIHVRRLNENLEEIAVWDVPSAYHVGGLGHMRDFAAVPEGIYELTFPGEPLPNDFQMTCEHLTDTTHLQIIGVQFDGGIDPIVLFQQQSNVTNYLVYKQVNSLEEVISSTGETWWQDKASNMVWVKMQGGRWQESQWAQDPYENIYEAMLLRIYQNNN
ncbi:MAG: right-handed parallel beta-helix repeat-containing protein [Cyclobacteriaceae bacterium]|nr:right-handed parallel beta-helix repeat-containing protein [Cyclobacteriaceae bacterium HetDA_MAG_MS6]